MEIIHNNNPINNLINNTSNTDSGLCVLYNKVMNLEILEHTYFNDVVPNQTLKCLIKKERFISSYIIYIYLYPLYWNDGIILNDDNKTEDYFSINSEKFSKCQNNWYSYDINKNTFYINDIKHLICGDALFAGKNSEWRKDINSRYTRFNYSYNKISFEFSYGDKIFNYYTNRCIEIKHLRRIIAIKFKINYQYDIILVNNGGASSCNEIRLNLEYDIDDNNNPLKFNNLMPYDMENYIFDIDAPKNCKLHHDDEYVNIDMIRENLLKYPNLSIHLSIYSNSNSSLENFDKKTIGFVIVSDNQENQNQIKFTKDDENYIITNQQKLIRNWSGNYMVIYLRVYNE